MVAGGLGETLILSKIQHSPANFNVELDTILALKENGISDTIITAMVEADNIHQQTNTITPEPRPTPKKRIAVLDQLLLDIDQAQKLKKEGNPEWRHRIRPIATTIKTIYRAHAYDIKYWWAYTQYSILIDRARHIEKGIKKVLYFNPEHQEALIVKGDLNFKEARGMFGNNNDNFGVSRDDIEKEARKAYRTALNLPQLRTTNRARIHYQLGEMNLEFRNKTKAKRQWSKAIDAAPHSSWANLARTRLNLPLEAKQPEVDDLQQ